MHALASPEIFVTITIVGAGVAGITTAAALGLHRRLSPDMVAAVTLTALVAGLILALVASGALRHW